ncbi:MAG: hypothetical protein R3C52_01580 [Hyphomonadaceae bacterium]
MRVAPISRVFTFHDRREAAGRRRIAERPAGEERRKSPPNAHSQWISAPFGAHILGQMLPSPPAPGAAMKAYAEPTVAFHGFKGRSI